MRMKNFKGLLLLLTITTMSLSCVNNDYDLSDVDTTVSMKVNNLTIPLNLDEVTLKSVLDLDDDSQIKEVNGEYAIIENGEFCSDKVELPSFTIEVPSIDPIQEELSPDIHISLEDFMGNGGYPSFFAAMENIIIPDDWKIVSFDIENAKTKFENYLKSIGGQVEEPAPEEPVEEAAPEETPQEGVE